MKGRKRHTCTQSCTAVSRGEPGELWQCLLYCSTLPPSVGLYCYCYLFRYQVALKEMWRWQLNYHFLSVLRYWLAHPHSPHCLVVCFVKHLKGRLTVKSASLVTHELFISEKMHGNTRIPSFELFWPNKFFARDFLRDFSEIPARMNASTLL